MYSKEVIKHFKHPKNMGEMKNPDAVGEVGNPQCGDILKFYIKVDDNKIKDIKFETLGCAVAIAVSSMMTTMVKGKTLNQAAKITMQDIIKELGGLPFFKHHCSSLAIQALKKAIDSYKDNLTEKVS
ncbi:iron-sulfur cluster assembly scaffold protein [Patescibacteria group bacterium]|nr:iron-sulfur cluster assembly scaffold protein [Patescibacteria group bacterium]MBU1563548.1 iron-sulfur cluster assembly scaffold protein [Patescibacteria group bacterium]MBU2068483.1 iron-sulfur cluster assembly scaffold protein [Patescibacteria group bacterium]